MTPPSDRPTPSPEPPDVVATVPADDAGVYRQNYISTDAINATNGIGQDIVHGNNDVPRL